MSIHVIITRFSVRFGMATEKRGDLFDETRLTKRVELFRTICFPSMASQTSQDFHWVILIDKELPLMFKDQLAETLGEYPNFHLVVWEEGNALGANNWLNNVIPLNRYKHLISTRLDDDDALHNGFVELVKQLYNKPFYAAPFSLLSFPRGIIWAPETGKQLPFFMNYIALGMTQISLIKKYPLNVYSYNHSKLKIEFNNRFKGTSGDYFRRVVSNRIGRPVSAKELAIRDVMHSVQTAEPIYRYTIHADCDSGNKYYAKLFNEKTRRFPYYQPGSNSKLNLKMKTGGNLRNMRRKSSVAQRALITRHG